QSIRCWQPLPQPVRAVAHNITRFNSEQPACSRITKELIMPRFIEKPTEIEAAGNMPKIIQEFFGRVNSQTKDVSIARMRSPQGWVEPAQTPNFDEYTVVLKGMLRVETKAGTFDV